MATHYHQEAAAQWFRLSGADAPQHAESGENNSESVYHLSDCAAFHPLELT
jgi:hypothetical protein